LPPLARLAGPYTRSKAKAHALTLAAAAAGQPIRIVYPTIPIGPGDEALTAPTVMIRDFLTGRVPAYLQSLMSYVPVEDAARGHILAARRGVPGGRYILSGEDLWLRELLDIVEGVSGRPMPRFAIPFWPAYAAGALSSWASDWLTRIPPKAPLEGVRLVYAARPVDGSLACGALGFVPTPVEAAVRRLIAWLEAAGHVPEQRRSDSDRGRSRVKLSP
jgi:dihydroflavonol-4-reductase